MLNAAYILPAAERRKLHKRNFKTYDIIRLVNEVERTDRDDVAEFAKQFPPTMAGLRRLYNFVLQNIRYQEDPDGTQWVQTPSHLWATRTGDCKSYTVFISAVLHNMGLDRVIRYVSYGSKNYTHVYPVAILPSGRRVVMDVVYSAQNGARLFAEKRFKKKKDYKVKAQPGLYKLGNAEMAELATSVAELESMAAQLPASIVHEGPGDITNMTAGEFDLYMLKDSLNAHKMHAQNEAQHTRFEAAIVAVENKSVAGIGALQNNFGSSLQDYIDRARTNNDPAFKPFALEVMIEDAAIEGKKEERKWQRRRRKLEREIRQAKRKNNRSRVARLEALLQQHYNDNPDMKKKKNLFEKIGGAVRDAWKKVVNWVFKDIGKIAAPYFLFLFIKNTVKSPAINRRKAVQQKNFNWLSRVGKMDEKKLSMLMATGIKEKTGMTPSEIIKKGKRGAKVGAVALAALIPKIIQALGAVVQIVQKIAGIFKKKKSDAGAMDESTMSDPSLLSELSEADAQSDGKFDSGNGSGGGEGSKNGLLAIAAGAALFAMSA